jgi:hypothetical protein
VTRDAVFVLLVCTGLAQGHPLTTSATIALVPHFEKPSGRHILHQLAPMVAEVFRPAGLSLEWYENPRAAPANTARTLDVWFHGNCWLMPAEVFWNSPPASLRLGWVVSRGGHIAADINIDCAVVMQLAAKAQTVTTNRPLLGLVFLRLMERVVAHELLHVLLMSASHGDSELRRPQMSASDWRRIGCLTDAEVQLLRKFYRPEAPVAWTQNR